jgi:hypothetical protein
VKDRRVIALLMLLVFGAVRMPFENALEKEGRAHYFHGAKFDLALRQRVGQMAFVAAFSGFRLLVAEGLFLHAFALWQKVEWGAMKLDFDAATALEPRCIMFWQNASWHMAYNASVAAYDDKSQPREALRKKAQIGYWKLGEEILLRGIANNPDSPTLYIDLGNLYRDHYKFEDHCRAAKAYAEAAKIKGAPVYAHRFAVYELAQCPGHEREAYEQLRALYKAGDNERFSTLFKLLGKLQEKLNVPADQRIYIPPPEHP